ncbi:hypothetical protein QBC34DRAFT_455819 [Podospora aff. communis PSN243]|uniref:F-box domain-containing protein n=1 Tax=Podospora aff. communis PSN243 TaxID=3040156 RepID=A0AAV9GYL1_9PEZI|nr:hypothetical protein QBC34DRAFT_455819 [Podospora aff. communis PSN243]
MKTSNPAKLGREVKRLHETPRGSDPSQLLRPEGPNLGLMKRETEDESTAEWQHPAKRRRLRLNSIKFHFIRLDSDPTYPAKRRASPYYEAGFPSHLLLRSKMDDLASRFHKLRLDATSIESLPNEILIKIAEFLIPEPVTIGLDHQSFLRRRLSNPAWIRFFDDRQNLINLSYTSRRFRGTTNPLIYRNIFLCEPASLCRLVAHLDQNPSLGSLVRHLNSAIELEDPNNVKEVGRVWTSLMPCSAAGRRRLDTSTSRIHAFGLLEHWSRPWIRSSQDYQSIHFPAVVLASLLGFTTRIEVLGIFLRRHPSDDLAHRSPLWKWLVMGRYPFLEQQENQFRRGNRPVLTCQQQLRPSLLWPPPFLRQVVIEHDRHEAGSGCSMKFDMVPRSEAVRHLAIRERYGLVTKFTNPPTCTKIFSLEPEARPAYLVVRSYLDRLKEIPSIKNADEPVSAFIDRLKDSVVGAGATKRPRADPRGSLGFTKAVVRLMPYPIDYLCITKKHVVFDYLEFLAQTSTVRCLEMDTKMSVVQSLEIRSGERVNGDLRDHQRRDSLIPRC